MSLAITITCFFILIAGLFAVIVERTTERDVARHDATQLARQLDEALDAHADCPAPVAAVTERMVEAVRVAVERPDLRVVPPQRDGSEYEWPAIVRAVEGETGGAS